MSYRRLARFNKKGPTQVKNPYVVFNPHDGEFPLPHDKSVYEFYGRPDETFVQITAIDPGIKNCGFRIERRWSGGTVETVMLARINFLVSEDNEISDTMYYRNAIRTLRNYLPYIEMSQYIIMESQLPINYDMVRMSTHIISFLMTHLENKGCKPMICEVDTYFKSRILNAPPKMTKPELKKWCRDYALDLLRKRGDTVAYNAIIEAGKQDDISDCVCYCEGWWKALTEGVQTIKCPVGGLPETHLENKVEILAVPRPITKSRKKKEEIPELPPIVPEPKPKASKKKKDEPQEPKVVTPAEPKPKVSRKKKETKIVESNDFLELKF